jgi:hypothetical protein
MPEETLLAFADHGNVGGTLSPGPDPENDAVLARFAAAGVDLTAFAQRLQEQGVDSFIKAWNDLLGRIEQKAAAVAQSRWPVGCHYPVVSRRRMGSRRSAADADNHRAVHKLRAADRRHRVVAAP